MTGLPLSAMDVLSGMDPLNPDVVRSGPEIRDTLRSLRYLYDAEVWAIVDPFILWAMGRDRREPFTGAYQRDAPDRSYIDLMDLALEKFQHDYGASAKGDAYAITRDILAWLVGNPTYMVTTVRKSA